MRSMLRGRRKWLALGSALVLGASLGIPAMSFADLPGGCDFSPANDGTAVCSNPLSGSTFAGGDGNLLTSPTTYGTTDWQNVSGRNTGVDLTSGTGDNSFGQGTKEDSADVTIVSGSIPPNKSDLTRFYEASETAGPSDHIFLYLAWERSNVLGNANMDFEINQSGPSFTSSTTGPVVLDRKAGDLLVTYDFTNGGGVPTIGLLTWVTTGSTSQCFSSNTLPCWGNEQTLSSPGQNASAAIAAVNNLDSVTDPIANESLAANTFGEAAIDLTAAGVFQAGVCKAFGSAFLKSRSSASFTSEVKDFIAPVSVSISNCGEVKIVKNTDPRGINQNFSYTSTLAGTNISCSPDTTPASFTLNDNGGTKSTTNTEDCTNVPTGSYTVVEGAEPTGFVLKSLTCTTGGSQDATNPMQADITLVADAIVTCTYVNQQQLGAIKITKVSDKKDSTGNNIPLAGATFSVVDSTNTAVTGSPFTTGSDGTFCVGGLAFGTYSVTETAAPTGFSIDTATAQSVSVTKNSTCGDGNEATKTFTDTPLTDISATATSEATTGGTKSTITCTNASSANVGNSPQGPAASATVSAKGLTPGTYTCTITIDP